MKNPCFEVYLNQELLCKAGSDVDYAVISTILTWVRRKLDESESLELDVSGLNSIEDKNLKWVSREVTIGDQIRIIITDDTTYTPAVIKPTLTQEEILKYKLRHFYQLKDHLKE